MSRKPRTPSSESCPKCKSDRDIRPKLLMLVKYLPADGLGCNCQIGGLGIHRCNPQVLLAPLEQFVMAFYCDGCGIGYVPDSYLLPDSYMAQKTCHNRQ
jgi:hypothetical protein